MSVALARRRHQLGSSEEITGKLIREFGLNRDEIVVAAKVNFEMLAGKPNGAGSSRKNIMTEIDHSLKRLGLDYVDLYQIHRLDAFTPIEEIMEALHDVVKSGKARYLPYGVRCDRSLHYGRMVVQTSAEHRRTQPLDEVHHHAEPVQPDLSRGRTRNDASVP